MHFKKLVGIRPLLWLTLRSKVMRISPAGIDTVSSIQPSPPATTKEVLNIPLPGNLWQNYWHLNQCLMALFKVAYIYLAVFFILPTGLHTSTTSECADRNFPPSPPIHRSQSEPKTEGWRTSLGEVFLWVFPTQSIVTRDFTEQLNHESKMVWKWGTSEEEREDRKSEGISLERGGDGK